MFALVRLQTIVSGFRFCLVYYSIFQVALQRSGQAFTTLLILLHQRAPKGVAGDLVDASHKANLVIGIVVFDAALARRHLARVVDVP